jgi:hypothetical protein
VDCEKYRDSNLNDVCLHVAVKRHIASLIQDESLRNELIKILAEDTTIDVEPLRVI